MKYEFDKIEKKWQDKWAEAKIFEASEDHTKPKFYGLVERIRGNGGRLCARESRSVMERASPALSGGYREK